MHHVFETARIKHSRQDRLTQQTYTYKTDTISKLVDTSLDYPEEINHQPQLRMVITAQNVRKWPLLPSAAPFQLRPYKPGDENNLINLMESCGFAGWNARRLAEYLNGPERIAGSRVIADCDTIAAATFASQNPEKPSMGQLDYVVTHPRYRRQGLARAVCTAVLRFLEEKHYQEITLSTDDWRLEAIALYMSLGFAPVMEGPDVSYRWTEVVKQIKAWRKFDA